MPVDRETGRPRGFAFVEFADRTAADKVVQKFDAQPFQGRNLAVSEARAREDRPPQRPSGGGFGGGGGGFAPRPGGGGFPGSRDRSANFGPPAPPRRLRGPKRGQGQDHKVRGPIKEKATGRIYAVDDAEDDTVIDIDNVATRAPEDATVDAGADTVMDDATTDAVRTDDRATPAKDDETDDQDK